MQIMQLIRPKRFSLLSPLAPNIPLRDLSRQQLACPVLCGYRSHMLPQAIFSATLSLFIVVGICEELFHAPTPTPSA